ncbi:MAG: hypothetical protein A2169_08710 [Deltaproteobacteria bacterium RBG_13_47_9]|nr:MAG: hypothetical protein A2169_08710 [Deltaproteobacteria bacterium RBG_13_47_9]
MFLFPDRTIFHEPHLLGFNAVQKFGRGFVLRILRDEFAADREVEDGLAELVDVFRVGGAAWEVVQKK